MQALRVHAARASPSFSEWRGASALRSSAASLLIAAALLVPIRLDAATRPVSLRTEDGLLLAASYYEPSRRPAPGVILLHMLGRSRHDWGVLADRLAREGLAVLAVDLRGHGSSTGAADGDLRLMLADVRAAARFLDARPEVLADRRGVAGASLGASLAVLFAATDPTVRSLALLSAGLEYRGLSIEAGMRAYGDRPALLVTSSDDPYAVRTARELQKAGPGPRELLSLDRAGHGTVMLARHYDLPRAVVDWFRRTLL